MLSCVLVMLIPQVTFPVFHTSAHSSRRFAPRGHRQRHTSDTPTLLKPESFRSALEFPWEPAASAFACRSDRMEIHCLKRRGYRHHMFLMRWTFSISFALLGRVCFFFVFCYTFSVASVVNLSYKLKLFPSRNKADTLALLTALFRKSHADATHLIAQGQGRRPSTKGLGEFVGRAYRRAYIDYRRTTKAGHTPGA